MISRHCRVGSITEDHDSCVPGTPLMVMVMVMVVVVVIVMVTAMVMAMVVTRPSANAGMGHHGVQLHFVL